ncbi:MAG: hypothetical protein L7U61_06580 [Flavobacteriaceae bacterium]|nr:hypothetical protein [Flavobacteriaceae bacterium]
MKQILIFGFLAFGLSSASAQEVLTKTNGGASWETPSDDNGIYSGDGKLVTLTNIDYDGFSLYHELTTHDVFGIKDGSVNMLTVNASPNEIEINGGGSADVNFEVKSDNDAMIFVDASEDEMGVGTTSPQSTLDVDGSVSLPIRLTASTTTLSSTDYTILVSGSPAPTITLPSASSCEGRMYRIIRSLSGTGTITSYVTSTGPASTSYTQGALILQGDGSNWRQVN